MAQVTTFHSECGLDRQYKKHVIQAPAITILTQSGDGEYLYRFECPDCKALVVNSANVGLVEVLQASGARLQSGESAIRPFDLKYLGPDDLTDARELLDGPDALIWEALEAN